jgi:hypothetical protein
MAEPAAPAWLPEQEPTFGEALRRQLGVEPPPPPSPLAAAESWVPELSPFPATGLPFSVPPPLAPRLDVLDASWSSAVEGHSLAPVSPADPDPAAAPLPEAPGSLLEAAPASEPAVVLFDPVRNPEPGAGPDLRPDLSSSGPGDAPGTGSVAWSADELVRIGLPFTFIRPLLNLDPGDDLAWIRGLAVSVHTLCRPLPTGDVALVGGLAGHLAKPLRLEALRRPDRGPKRGSICCSMLDDADSRRWFERIRRDRWIHLVVGVPDARAFLDLHPKAVSCVGADALPGAVRLASELDVPLGYFKPGEAGPALRATPIEVALGVRALVVRR